MKKAIAIIALLVLLAIGVGIIAYPFISNCLMSLNVDSEVRSYLNNSSQLTQSQYEEELKKAQEYNKGLIGNIVAGDPLGQPSEDDDDYYDLLNVGETSVMAALEIPVINFKYPVYHGTDNETLSKGIGHLKNTSLPVGGKGTHSVLTGHTGYTPARFFTDLDKLEYGDIFFISVLNEVLAYEVDQILVVEPTDTSSLQIDPEKDYVTLVTCTPYGINSHRLLVRGSRIPYDEAVEKNKIRSSRDIGSTWADEYMFAIIIGACVMAGILIVYFLVRTIINLAKKRKETN